MSPDMHEYDNEAAVIEKQKLNQTVKTFQGSGKEAVNLRGPVSTRQHEVQGIFRYAWPARGKGLFRTIQS